MARYFAATADGCEALVAQVDMMLGTMLATEVELDAAGTFATRRILSIALQFL